MHDRRGGADRRQIVVPSVVGTTPEEASLKWGRGAKPEPRIVTASIVQETPTPLSGR
jgi:hypothetical protein